MKWLFAIILISMHEQAHANPKDRLVSVTGECSLNVTADRGSLTVTIDHLNKEVKPATQKTAEVYSQFKKEVEAMNLKNLELKTSEYQVYEQKDWENNKHVSKGFRARMGLNVSTEDIARLGDIMNVAGKLGITDVGNLNTYASEGKLKGLENQCLKDAALDAKKKAETLASALGAKIKEVVTINTSEVNLPMPRPFQQQMMHKSMRTMEAASSAEVEGGKEKYSLKIQATFRID